MLPTSTATSRRTKTINTTNNPEWNESFSFRVPKKTKNILEIRVLDEDLLSRDDLVSMVLLDLDTLEMDSNIRRTFSLSPEVWGGGGASRGVWLRDFSQPPPKRQFCSRIPQTSSLTSGRGIRRETGRR
uniref:C2 domain-containing protein n=1 Tax=Knipowitschia caucasica TaxID=637954 RepID=A0AAV2JLS7_KNICA